MTPTLFNLLTAADKRNFGSKDYEVRDRPQFPLDRDYMTGWNSKNLRLRCKKI
jgi:hypothetical protein